MIPVLYKSTEKEFATQGIGALKDAVSCTVTEERNGTYELTMKYPITGIHYADIKERNIIAAIPSPYREKQPFRIYKISKPLSGIITVYAAHVSYDLNGIPVAPFEAGNIEDALSGLSENAQIANSFAYQTDIVSSSGLTLSTPKAARTVLGGMQGSFLDVYGGEYEWDKFTIKLLKHRGKDNGVTIRYGKNMTKLDAEIDVENIVTGIYPYWQKEETLVIADIVWMENAPYQKAIPVDFTQDFDEAPTKEQLTERAKTYITENGIGKVQMSINVSFVQLEQMSGYESLKNLEKCDLCDTVTIQYADLGVDVSAEIVSITTNVLLERYDKMQVGTIRADVAQTIVDQEQKIDGVIRNDGSLIAEKLFGFIDSAKASLYAQYNAAEKQDVMAMLFENNDAENPLYGALAMGTQGLMISKQKKADGSGWEWTTALTASGLIANIIVAGIIADKTGNSWWDLDNGEINLAGVFKSLGADGGYCTLSDNELSFYTSSGTRVAHIYSKTNTGRTLYITSDANDPLAANAPSLILQGQNGNVILQAPNTLTLTCGTLKIDSLDGKSGRAEFSDGSYLTFRKGLLVGGRTSGGTTF